MEPIEPRASEFGKGAPALFALEALAALIATELVVAAASTPRAIRLSIIEFVQAGREVCFMWSVEQFRYEPRLFGRR